MPRIHNPFELAVYLCFLIDKHNRNPKEHMKRYGTFLINLKHDTKRRNFMIKQLEAINLEYTVVDAVYGSDISEGSLEIDWNWYGQNQYWVSKGLLGCSLSHVKACKQVVDNNLDFGLILEDDTLLHDNLPQTIQNLLPHLGEEEIVFFYYASKEICMLKKNTEFVTENGHSFFYAENPRKLLAGNAYLISRKSCEKMIAFQRPLKATSDSWGVFYEKGIFNTARCAFPRLCDAADYKSSIDYVPSNTVTSALLKSIDTYKIPPFYQVLKAIRNRKRKEMLKVALV
jgi:glycosyl transferase family 25